MSPIMQDPIGALRAAVESHQRYSDLTGHELDCLVLSPTHAIELLRVVEELQTMTSSPSMERIYQEHLAPIIIGSVFPKKWDERCLFGSKNLAICSHTVISKFTSTGEVYCHECRQTFEGDIETHRRSSTIEK